MTDHIPPISSAKDPIHSQSDMYDRWRALMGELGFSERLLWFNFVDADRRMTPLLSQVEDLPARPDDLLLVNLMEICRQVLDTTITGGSVALLLSRPGSAYVTANDRDWASSLTRAAAQARVPIEPIHLANDRALSVFAADDLDLRRSA